MTLDPNRLERQKQIARNFWNRGGIGAFLAATGFGKTMVARIVMVMLRKKYPEASITIVVPSDYLRNQWRDNLKEWKIDKVQVETVQMLVKRPQEATLLILDELHSYTSPVFSLIFQSITYRFVLGMTATLADDDEKNQIIYEKCPIFDEVTLKECLEKAWVSPFVLYNYGLNLNPADRTAYNEITSRFNKYFAIFGHDLKLVFSCMNNNTARNAYAEQLKWDPKALLIYSLNVMKAMRERKEFLYNHPDILRVGADIINRHGTGRKIITFSQTSHACDILTEQLGEDRAMSYHTNLKARVIDGKKYNGKKLREKIIELYNEGKIYVLNTAKALDQGVDIQDIDMSLVCSGSSSVRQSIQRTGRNIRKKEGKRAYEINLYIRDTQSEKWLRKRQAKHPRSTIKYISDMNEIVIL